VTWAISQGELALLDPHESSAGNENELEGEVVKLLRLGNNAAITVAVGGAERPPLFVTVPLHVAHSQGIEAGTRVRMALVPAGIHLMPADAGDGSERSKRRRMQPASDLAT
jgi:hypothetical protein